MLQQDGGSRMIGPPRECQSKADFRREVQQMLSVRRVGGFSCLSLVAFFVLALSLVAPLSAQHRRFLDLRSFLRRILDLLCALRLILHLLIPLRLICGACPLRICPCRAIGIAFMSRLLICGACPLRICPGLLHLGAGSCVAASPRPEAGESEATRLPRCFFVFFLASAARILASAASFFSFSSAFFLSSASFFLFSLSSLFIFSFNSLRACFASVACRSISLRRSSFVWKSL